MPSQLSIFSPIGVSVTVTGGEATPWRSDLGQFVVAARRVLVTVKPDRTAVPLPP